MKCPLRHKFVSADQGGPDVVFLPCIKEECAWWNSKLSLCSVAVLALETRLISESMTYLETRMPTPPTIKR